MTDEHQLSKDAAMSFLEDIRPLLDNVAYERDTASISKEFRELTLALYPGPLPEIDVEVWGVDGTFTMRITSSVCNDRGVLVAGVSRERFGR